jgi:hypothetical protein
MQSSNIALKMHPAKRNKLPKGVVQPTTQSKIQKPLQFPKPKRKDLIELRKHFISFEDKSFKSLRSRCLYCNAEHTYNCEIMRRHLNQCALLPVEVVPPPIYPSLFKPGTQGNNQHSRGMYPKGFLYAMSALNLRSNLDA